MTVEAKSYPWKSTYGAAALAAVSERKLPRLEALEMAKRFARVSLVEVDSQDAVNYPVRFRTFKETLEIYHPEIEWRTGEKTEEVEKKIHRWVKERGIKKNEVVDWFAANLVWEHVMGGGSVGEIPKGWERYLRVSLGGITQGYPGSECVRDWKQYEAEEKILIYRTVTNYWYTRAFAACLEVNNFEPLVGAVTIYQINTDRFHQKNAGEPLMSLAVDEIRTRDKRHNDWEEAKVVGRMSNLGQMGILGVYAATRIMCCRNKKAEWDV